MKAIICSISGAVGSTIAYFLGGWDNSIATLLLFMLIDYISGLFVAGVFKKSPKTDTGRLESRAGWKGLCKKGATLFFIVVANRLDIQLGTTYIRDAVCIAFITNELISIVENAGLMGLPIPAVIINTIDLLKKKGANNGQTN
ncbi:MAG: phage holin family protein [Methanobrevibacter sp.]|nr:phage holin family protein [Methanobrevibacter sp.]